MTREQFKVLRRAYRASLLLGMRRPDVRARCEAVCEAAADLMTPEVYDMLKTMKPTRQVSVVEKWHRPYGLRWYIYGER